MSPDWPLMRRIPAELVDDDGQIDDQFAELLGAPTADVRQAARILYRQRRADYCAGQVVLVSPARQGGKPHERPG